MMKAPDFILASSEGYNLESPRKCWKIKQLKTPTRNDLLLIRIDPPLIGQKYGIGESDIEYLIVATRHKGSSLFHITEWPVYVHVARLLVDLPIDKIDLQKTDYETIAWAELYRSEKDAIKGTAH